MSTSLVLSSRALAASLVDERSLPGHLRCSSCAKPVVNSFQTPHGCRLCQTCVDSLPASDRVPCPGKTDACKDPDEDINISQSSCFPDIASRREINKLKVFCPNKADVCRVEFQWRDADSHLAKCDFEKVQCDMCGELKLKKEMEEHKKSMCSKRLVTCDDCRTQVVAAAMDSEHRSLQSGTCCKQFRAACPHCREGNFSRETFLGHLSQCPQKLTPCKFAHLGCDFVAPAAELAAHCSDSVDKHLELIDVRLRVSVATAAAAPAGATAMSAGASVAPAPALVEANSKEMKDLERKAMNIFTKFKGLQPNVGAWALTTMSLEDFIKELGGPSGFKNMLKNIDDKLRQLEATERSSGTPDAPSASAAATPTTTSAEVSRLMEQMRAIEMRALGNQSRDSDSTDILRAYSMPRVKALGALGYTSFDGGLVWKVVGVAAKLREAESDHSASLFSPQFMSKRYGYMFHVRLFLNYQEGADEGHVAIQLVLIQRDYDETIQWPLVADVTFRLFHRQSRSYDLVVKMILNAQRAANSSDLTKNACVLSFGRIAVVQEKFVRNDSIYLDVEVEPRTRDATRRSRRRVSGYAN